MKNTVCKRIIATLLAIIIVFGAAPAAGLAGLSDFFGSLMVSAAVGTWGGETATSLSGTGTAIDPYIINTAAQLAFLAASINSGTNYSGKFIKLTSDITLNSSDMFARNENGVITGAAQGKTPQSWTAIGTSSSKDFRGTFDGNGHTVSGIYIDTAIDYQGLFGYVNYGTIKNLGVIDSYISGGSNVGGVVGYNNDGIVKNIYNAGTVSGNEFVGGVVGYNRGSVTNSYNAGMVSGNNYVGGVVGYNITNVGDNYYLTGTASYGVGWHSSNTGAAPLTDAQMKTQSSFADWDFNSIWAIDNQNGYEYPQFISNLTTGGENAAIWDGSVAEGFDSGSGSQSDPYIIKTNEQLAFLASSVNSGTNYSVKYIELAADLTLNDYDAKYWTRSATSWIPIGTSYSNCFAGIFDGNGHTVSGIYIYTASDHQGLFGYSCTGKISNVGVINSYISGERFVGGVVGYNDGTVMNSYNAGTVSGNEHVGGVAGFNDGTFMHSYNTGTVSGESYIGGVAGSNDGTFMYSYNTGTVSGYDHVGGVVGGGIVTNSYNAGQVSGRTFVGGVTGYNLYGRVTNSYYLTGTAIYGNGSSYSNSGVAPLTDAQMKTQGSFAGWDFSTVWTMDGDPDYPYPELLFLSDDSIHVTDVNISRTTLTVDVDSKSQLSATVIPSDATDQAVTWKSSNTAVATVSSSGIVTAKAAGTATITVTTVDGGYTDICEVTVVHVIPVELSKIEIQSLPTKLSYYKGETLDTAGLVIELTYKSGSKATKTSGFTCSPTTLNTLGTQTITVSYGGKSCTFSVSVNSSILPTSIKLSATSMSLDYKSSGSLTATVSPTDATNKTVEWTSSDPKVADVDKSSGKVTATGKGTATITAKIVGTDISASCTVTVKYTFIQWIIIILLFGWLWY